LEKIVMSAADEITPRDGLPGRVMDVERELRGIRGALQSCTNGISQCLEDIGRLAAGQARLEARFDRASLHSIPPMRAELPSTVTVRTFAEQVKAAAVKGEKDPHSTPEREVEAILEHVEMVRRGRLLTRLLWLLAASAASFAADRLLPLMFHH
jgi:hypothetical protein